MLGEPVRIGTRTVRNRIVFPAHLTNAALDGLPSAQHAGYYAARAAGGAGLVIVEEQAEPLPCRVVVHPSDYPGGRGIPGSDGGAGDPPRQPDCTDVTCMIY